jgi:hypothetical protein
MGNRPAWDGKSFLRDRRSFCKNRMAKKTEFWNDMIKHISFRYSRLKGHDYPFTGKDFVELKNAARIFQPWGIMALWDIFIDFADDYTRKNGFSIWCFLRQIPKLTDNPLYKPSAEKYQQVLIGTKPNKILELFNF